MRILPVSKQVCIAYGAWAMESGTLHGWSRS